MTSEQWKTRIVNACKESGTYRNAIEPLIETLADIMSLRDRAIQELLDSGEQAVVTKTSDRGAKNLAQNPRLEVVLDLNRTALPYWKELLLKPSAKMAKYDDSRSLADLMQELESQE